MMKLKTLLGAILAFAVLSCSCLMPLASAAAQRHSCCPTTNSSDQNSDCCLRVATHDVLSLVSPHLVVIGLVDPVTAAVVSLEILLLDSAALSPPHEPPLPGRSSRAPPTASA